MTQQGNESNWFEHDPLSGRANRPVVCPTCDWRGTEDDLAERGPQALLAGEFTPGGITPVGICPVDSGLLQYSDVQVVWRVVAGT